MKRIYCLLIILVLFSFNYKVNAASIEDKRKAVAEVAEAYLRKDQGRIQYEALRRNILYSPEEVTSQSTQYSSCAVYTTSVYYQAFNIINPYFARWFTDAGFKVLDGENWPNNEKAQVVSSGKCVESVDESSEESIKSSCTNIFKNSKGSIHDRGGYRDWYEEWYNLLEVGDVIGVVYNDNTAHTMIVTRKDSSYVDSSSIKFTEAAGGEADTYDLTNHAYSPSEQSTIKLLPLNSFYYRYKTTLDSNNHPRYVKRYSIVRFITNDDRLELTKSAQSRIKYPMMDIDKTSVVDNQYNNRHYVSPGNSITYKISITNNSSSNYENLKVVEQLDENVEVVSNSNGQINNNKISWTINVQAGKTVSLTYKVKVKKNITKAYVESKGSVDQIPSRTIVMKVGNSLTKAEQTSLTNTFNSINKSGKNDFKVMNDLYKKVFSIELFPNDDFDITKVIKVGKCYTIQNYLGNTDTITDYCDVNIDNDNYNKMTIGNYYSVQSIKQKNVPNTIFSDYIFEEASLRSNKSLITEVMVNDLQVGDILIVDNDEDHDTTTINEEAYIYLNNKFIKGNGEKEYSSDSLNELLNSLIGKHYIIIRPAQLLHRNSDNGEIIKVDNTLKNQSIIVVFIAIVLIITGLLVVKKQVNDK